MLWASLLMFLPAIAAMGGNSGMQTSIVVVRGLATGDLAALDMLQVYLRELRIGLMVGTSCAAISGLVSFLGMNFFSNIPHNDISSIGLSVGLAMFAAIMVSTSLGLTLPFLFRKIGIDPAISCGPLITTSNDIISSVVFFSICLLLMQSMAG